MLVMKWADVWVSRWGEKQITLVMHPYILKSSKTHKLMLAMKWADEKRNRLLWSCIHAYIHNSIKLTSWCWQWSEQMRRETGNSGHASIHTQVSKTHRLMLAMKWADETRNRLLWSYIHNKQFSKTHKLMLAMKWADEKRNRLLWSCIHAYIHNSIKLTSWCWQWSEQMRKETGYSGHASIHNQVSKTHRLMLVMKWADETRNRLLWSCIHNKQFSKLTNWCWQWSEQMRS